ncbi:urease accessory protein UreD [Nocardioides stalactiti]|uniref:urease accessory protein UreD n=1 Tax=Nocardioides stalactiti TaxID=2755356 RepID=UPI0015FF79AD|nr:urease accessory protein UreD [Nocardioides stalactiti]
MLTSTERVGRTRIRVGASPDGGRCRVRSTSAGSDPGASSLRAVLVHHDATGATISLVPEGALLLAGDAIEIDVTVDAGARLHLIEPAGTVAFDMRGGRARWDVRVRLEEDAALTWAGEPFVVAAGADVERTTRITMANGAAAAVRDTLVLGRYGEGPGRVRQRTSVSSGATPWLVEDLPLGPVSAPGLLGGHRVVASVLLLGTGVTADPDRAGADRLDLEHGGHQWRRLGAQAHEAALPDAWALALDTVR